MLISDWTEGVDSPVSAIFNIKFPKQRKSLQSVMSLEFLSNVTGCILVLLNSREKKQKALFIAVIT